MYVCHIRGGVRRPDPMKEICDKDSNTPLRRLVFSFIHNFRSFTVFPPSKAYTVAFSFLNFM